MQLSIEIGVDQPTAEHAPSCFLAKPKLPDQNSFGRKFEEDLQEALHEVCLCVLWSV